jgi:hypothetical protein
MKSNLGLFLRLGAASDEQNADEQPQRSPGTISPGLLCGRYD